MRHQLKSLKLDQGKKVKINQDVILSWIKGKGIEAPLASYKNKKLKINSGRVTTFSQYSVVSENRLYLKPKYFFKKFCFIWMRITNWCWDDF